MRLVDADELKRGIEALCKDERASISAATYFALMAFINKMPTIEAETVKHAKWIWMKNYRDCEGDIYSQYKCSCCDFSVGRAAECDGRGW